MPARTVTPGYVVVHPNRERPSCRRTRLLVVAALVASAALILTITIGGWSELQGLRPVDLAWAAVYLLLAFHAGRWARGPLPIAAVLACLLLAFSAISILGLDGTSWFARRSAGYAPARALLGGAGLSDTALGVLTLAVIFVQALLAAAAMVGFSQRWSMELEVPAQAPAGTAGERRAAA
ncbi:MAG TPA: hypothetical protein VKV27_15360 [Solirubrobacteraceae bacterium]|nr:hypothetical protein [Solirubrobacteraceae bacterium]